MFESKIIKFYEKCANDNYGRSLDDMQHYNYEQLENIHDYIQWMFPLNKKSRVNLSAPVLNDKDILYIKDSNTIKQNMFASVLVITDFWGIGKEYSENKYCIKNDRVKTWLTPMNHNFLRISRVLKSLILFDMKNEAELLFKCFEDINNNGNKEIIGESFLHWKKAIK
ncbi:hypothetical protein FACS189485_22570 [Spirochaetia bacterium]|nr:hypothetical protein FACS189485_22570 [Spirochaetia bacterium]